MHASPREGGQRPSACISSRITTVIQVGEERATKGTITDLCQGCILLPCIINFCAVYIMQNARLDEAQAGIKIAGRNINNLRYADDTTLIAESEEELKSL